MKNATNKIPNNIRTEMPDFSTLNILEVKFNKKKYEKCK